MVWLRAQAAARWPGLKLASAIYWLWNLSKKLLKLSRPQLPHLEKKEHTSMYFLRLM